MAKSQDDGMELHPGSPGSVVACKVVRNLHEGADDAHEPCRESAA